MIARGCGVAGVWLATFVNEEEGVLEAGLAQAHNLKVRNRVAKRILQNHVPDNWLEGR